jgi:hypothetical protein
MPVMPALSGSIHAARSAITGVTPSAPLFLFVII